MIMKKIIRALSIMLSVLVMATCFACNDGKQNKAKTPTAKNPIQETHTTVIGGLHKVNVGKTSVPFISEGWTDYKIVIPDVDVARKAAGLIVTHVLAATGAELTVKTIDAVSNWSSEAKYIVIDHPQFFADAGLTMPNDALGLTGYYIKTVAKSVFIATESIHGYQQAAICFLRHLIGYEMYSPNVVKYHAAAKTLTLPDFTVIEKPDIEVRTSGNNLSDLTTSYGMGFNNRSDFVMSIDGKPYHNTSAVLKKAGVDTTLPYHPWISDDNTTFAEGVRQACYTAHGNEEELEKMITAISEVIITEMEKEENLTKTSFTLGIEDGWGHCKCKDGCQKEYDKYGTWSGAIVKFFNRLNRKIQAHLQMQADANGTAKRPFSIISFAYVYTIEPPVKEVNGKYEPVDKEVICDKEVGIMLAPIGASYREPLTAESNLKFKKQLDGWSEVCSQIHMWLYSTNFTHYLYANGFHRSMGENYRLMKEKDAVYIYNQGAYYHMSSHFTPLKEFLDAKLSFDVNLSVAALTQEFFDNYFDAASEPMRKMYDAIDIHYDYLMETYPEVITGWCYDTINKVEFWQFGMLQSYMGYIEQAYQAIAPYETFNPELYAALYENINRESIFPRFALLDLHSGKFSDEEFKTLAKSLKEDCAKLKIVRYGDQNRYLTTYWAKWGV